MNTATFLILLLVAGIIAIAVRHLLRHKGSPCGGCHECPSRCDCHRHKEKA